MEMCLVMIIKMTELVLTLVNVIESPLFGLTLVFRTS